VVRAQHPRHVGEGALVQRDRLSGDGGHHLDAANVLPPPGAARAILTLASLLDPNGIPMEFFATPAAVDTLPARH
jgi:hypothetical protein